MGYWKCIADSCSRREDRWWISRLPVAIHLYYADLHYTDNGLRTLIPPLNSLTPWMVHGFGA
jgi:hypothetical protein